MKCTEVTTVFIDGTDELCQNEATRFYVSYLKDKDYVIWSARCDAHQIVASPDWDIKSVDESLYEIAIVMES